MTDVRLSSTESIDIPRYYKPRSEGRIGLTRERIRQIENIAMRKFRRELVKRGISKLDLLA